ncbi:EAL domain-containing protein [Aerosakkonemataceae cyanobacterium BLCC-F50]|uniref:EAL domain-containing protein n=1 Tax=Floridaenema flaviceps BLCC-F50 TaxID=3153642 RepID=A0ABV4XMI9_9CYAN
MPEQLFHKLPQLLSNKEFLAGIKKFGCKSRLVFQQPVLITSLLVTGLLLGIRQMEVLQPLELMEFDRATQLKPEMKPDPRILVVGITEADIQAQKKWPLSDEILARLIATLQLYQPKVIGLDLYREMPYPPGHAELVKELQAQNVVVITKLGESESESVKPPPSAAKQRIGFNDFVLDPDGVIRRNFIFATLQGTPYYSFGLRISLKYLQGRHFDLKAEPHQLRLGKKIFPNIDPDSGGYQNIDTGGYQILLKYRSRSQNIASQVTLTQILNGEVDPALVKDKIVIIGTVAPSQKDLFFTPYTATDRENASMPGVLIHAQMVSQIVSTLEDNQPLFWFWPQWVEWFWLWGWSLIGGILVWRFRRPLFLGIATSVALVILLTVFSVSFAQAGWVPLMVPALGLLVTGSSVAAYKLFHDSFYDALTGLPNRTFLLKQIDKNNSPVQQQENSLIAVIFLDLDRFKIVNDNFNHQVGDRLLIAVTKRLKSCLRPQDIVARIGGDEFAVLLTNITNVNQATLVADAMQQQLSLPFNLKGEEIFISASFGIAFNQIGCDKPDDIELLINRQPEELLRDAHTAMYRAKALGKARYELFSTGMRTQIVSRLQLENELRRSIAELNAGTSQEFIVFYQPIISLKTGKIAGFEALIRWQPPGKFISPAEFIPLAEETGLIIPLGEWILKEACRQLKIWQEQFKMQSPLSLSVNLSSQQFSQPDLTERVEQILKETKLDGHNLKLEITESMAMQDVEKTIASILRLKALNLRFSIDDFGTGYSSLSYLHRFPVDTLKVDRSFVSRMEDSSENLAIVETVIMLSHKLGMDVVAEGVEKVSQMEMLRDLGCEYVQGYYFSKPLNSEAATALLAEQPQW